MVFIENYCIRRVRHEHADNLKGAHDEARRGRDCGEPSLPSADVPSSFSLVFMEYAGIHPLDLMYNLPPSRLTLRKGSGVEAGDFAPQTKLSAYYKRLL